MRERSFFDSIRWLPLKLTTSEACPSFGAVKVTGAVVEEKRLILEGTKLDTNVWQRVAIASESGIEGSGYGRVTFEPTMALCDSGTAPTAGETWGIKTGEWKLFRHRPGFRILGGVQGTGTGQRALVLPEPVLQLWGVLAGALAQGGSANMTVYYRDGGAWTSTSETITVYDRLLKVGAADIQSGKWVVADWYGDRWWASAAECNT